MPNDWPSITYIGEDALLIVDLLDRCQSPLLPAEFALADNVTGIRLRELKAGRSTARHALQLFGMETQPILAAPDGMPIWPRGFCGSLSHSHRHVAVLLARSSCYESVGVDIDDGRPLGAAASKTVVKADELEVIEELGWVASGSSAEGIAFSVKEAVFKCQFPLTRDSSLGFLDIGFEPDKSSQTLRIRLRGSERRVLRKIQNRIHIHLVNEFNVPIVYALMNRTEGANQKNV